MMKKGSSNIEFIATMILLILFSWVAFTFVISASDAYDKELSQKESIEETRIALSFIDNKVKQANKGDVSVERIKGNNVIVIKDESGFNNNLFFLEGNLYEVMTGEGEVLDPSLGMKIASIKSLDIDSTDDLISLEIVGQHGERQKLLINKGL